MLPAWKPTLVIGHCSVPVTPEVAPAGIFSTYIHSRAPMMTSPIPLPSKPEPANHQPESRLMLGGRSPIMSVLLDPSEMEAKLTFRFLVWSLYTRMPLFSGG